MGALREYRDAVGRRTREIVSAFKPGDWDGAVQADAVERAAAVGRLRAADRGAPQGLPGPAAHGLLSAIALLHSAAHMGEAATVRTAGGFGTGI